MMYFFWGEEYRILVFILSRFKDLIEGQKSFSSNNDGKLIQSVSMIITFLIWWLRRSLEFFFFATKVWKNKCLKGRHYSKVMTSPCPINFGPENSKSFLRLRSIIRKFSLKIFLVKRPDLKKGLWPCLRTHNHRLISLEIIWKL